MRKLVYAFAILAAAASTAAVAKDLKQDKKATAPVVAATQMSDAEMDNVTAGDKTTVPAAGFGIGTVVGGVVYTYTNPKDPNDPKNGTTLTLGANPGMGTPPNFRSYQSGTPGSGICTLQHPGC